MTTKYTAWCPGEYAQTEQDGWEREAKDYEGPREIARSWADWHDANGADYDIAVNEMTVTVMVRNQTTMELTAWMVTGESMPTYRARPVILPKGTP